MRNLIPFRPRTHQLLSELWNDDFFDSIRKPEYAFDPNVDIEETEQNYSIHLDLPGVKKSDVSIELEDNVLSISGERRRENRSEENGKLLTIERSYGKFARRFSLPSHVNDSKVKADFDHGVLTITLPKAESAKRKSIAIGA